MTWAVVAVVGVVLVALMVLLEVVARTTAKGSGADVWLKEPLLQRKDDRMRQLGRKAQPDVLFLGSSGIMCAVDPEILSREFGVTAYNAGIFRGTTCYVASWGRLFALRRLTPRIVVIEVWLPTINDNSDMSEHYNQHLKSPYFTSRKRMRFLYELGHWMTLLRLAPPAATAPIQLARQMGQSLQRVGSWTARRPVSLPGVIGMDGESVEHDAKLGYRTGALLQKLLRGMMQEWSMGAQNWSALTELIAVARAGGAQVLLLEPPYTDELAREYFPGGLPAWLLARELVEQRALELDALWLLPERMTEEAYFSDPVHANLAGKRHFSVAVGTALVQQRVIPGLMPSTFAEGTT